MLTVHISRSVPFMIDEVYNLIANVEIYPEIFDEIKSCKIIEHHDNQIKVKVDVTYKVMHYSYTCIVYFLEKKINIISSDGPFKRMDSSWVFSDLSLNGKKGTFVEYSSIIETKSFGMNKLLEFVIKKKSNKVVDIFVNYLKRNKLNKIK